MDEQRFGDLIADVKTGFSAVIGSWKISAISAPRTARISGSRQRQQVASLEEDAARRRSRPGGCTSRMIDSAVTDLPLPDSPTRPSVSPARISKLTSSTAGARPVGRSKTRREVRDVEQSASLSSDRRGLPIFAEHRPHRVGDLADGRAALRRR